MASSPDPFSGDVSLTYPAQLTKRLLVPLTEQMCKDEFITYIPENRDSIRQRKQACCEVQAQTW